MKSQVGGQVLQAEGTVWGKTLRQEKAQAVPRLKGGRSSQSEGRKVEREGGTRLGGGA